MDERFRTALFILPEYPPDAGGGIGTYYQQLLPHLVKRGIEVKAIVGSGVHPGPEQPLSQDGVTLVPLDQSRFYRLLSEFPALALAPDLVRHLAAAWAVWEQTGGGEGFDVVECTDWGLFFVPWLLQPSSPPLIVRLHGSEGQIAHHDPESCSPLYGRLCQLIEVALLPRAALLSTLSRSNQLVWSDQLGRTVEYCPPPLAVKSSNLAPMRSNGRGLVVGRVQRWKGPDILCRALQLMGGDAPEVDWIGRSVLCQATGQSYDAYLKQAFPEIWGSRIAHHEPEHPAQIGARQANASVVIVPSEWDVFNFTAVEAMAREAVVICSRGAGAVDLVEHGVNGFVFQAGDEQDLAAVMLQVQSLSPEQRRAMGVRARERIVEVLDPEEIARQTIKQYDQARRTPRQPEATHDLLRLALSPEESFDHSASAIHQNLERLDLKLLLRHVAGRLSRKVVELFDR